MPSWAIYLSIPGILLIIGLIIGLGFLVKWHMHRQDKKWQLLSRDEWPRWVVRLAYRKFRKGWDGGIITGKVWLYDIWPTTFDTGPGNPLNIDAVHRKLRRKFW